MRKELMTEHQYRVAKFMENAGQAFPDTPTIPSADVRLLRAKLIMEEALETINALGIGMEIRYHGVGAGGHVPIQGNLIKFEANHEPDLVEIADGCADISVVTIGTLIACGIADKPLLVEVDRSNLDKFELPRCDNKLCTKTDTELTHKVGGYYYCPNCYWSSDGPYRNEDGKWVKSSYWKKPDIEQILKEQGA